MSSESAESEVDDFFDAVDESPLAKAAGSRKPSVVAQFSLDSLDDSTSGSTSPAKATDSTASQSASTEELEARRRKLRRLRHCVAGDEEVQEPPSPHGSQTGSVEGVATRSSHPFRKVEQDAQSMVSQMSLGKVGRILAGVDDLDGAGAGSRTSVSETTLVVTEGTKKTGEIRPEASQDPDTVRMPPPPPPPPPLTSPAGPADDRPSRDENMASDPDATPRQEVVPTTVNTTSVSVVLTVAPEVEGIENGPVFSPSVALPSTSTVSPLMEHSAVMPSPSPPPPTPATPASAAAPLPIPDIVSSVVLSDSVRSDTSPVQIAAPVAPPRRRKKTRPPPVPELHSADDAVDEAPRRTATDARLRRGLPPGDGSPQVGRRRGLPDARAQITPDREHEKSLDIRSATKGQYVVKPQDEESARAPWVQALDQLDVISVQSDASSITDSCSLYQHYPHPQLRERVHSAAAVENMQRLDQVKEAQEFLRSHEIQTNIFVKTKTDSGRPLTDKEILDQVSVLNLDTGERIPLSVAEEKLPACINPLSLQIMRMTSEYISNSSIEKDGSDDDKKMLVIPPADEQPEPGSVRRKTAQLRRFMTRTVHKARDRAEVIAQKMAQVRHREEKDAFESIDGVPDAHTVVRVPMKASSSHKGPYEFDQLLFVQDFKGEHIGPVWCMKFSACGRLLATAGQDHVLRVWVLKSAYHYFVDMRTKYSAEKVSPTPSQESVVSQQSTEEALLSTEATSEEEAYAPFMPKPFCKYLGHTADLLDISWSKNYFILSSSMDKTVRLWHISRKECLCCFQHIEFVTAIAFHPKDDRYFLSGSLDGKLRLWNIPDKKVALWNELDGQAKLITAANFCQGGRFAVVGSYDGRCLFYSTDQLKYHTQIHVRSTRGKNARGRKISGIEPMPGEDKILITSNDSRVRLYDLRDLNLSCKYKGFTNNSSQIRASFSHDGKYIVAGSENQCVYIWKTHHDYSKFSSARRDRNDYWEGIKAHEAQVTCALFAPHPDLIFSHVDAELLRLEHEGGERGSLSSDTPAVAMATSPSGTPRSEDAKKDSLDKKSVGSGGTSTMGYVLVTADFNGCIKVFLSRTRPKHSSLPASALLRDTPRPAPAATTPTEGKHELHHHHHPHQHH